MAKKKDLQICTVPYMILRLEGVFHSQQPEHFRRSDWEVHRISSGQLSTTSNCTVWTIDKYRIVRFYSNQLIGSSTDNSLNFNVSISYADFWSDTPANDIFISKDVQYSDTTDCKSGSITSGGNNLDLQSKGFWIAFHFEDGRQLFFNVPAGPFAAIYRRTVLGFEENCDDV